jgi:hypothetical protein
MVRGVEQILLKYGIKNHTPNPNPYKINHFRATIFLVKLYFGGRWACSFKTGFSE